VFDQAETCPSTLGQANFATTNAKVEYGNGGEEMVDDVVVGDNIIVLCQNFINESFWIMLVDTLPIWSRNIS
jgi:hypothetical protein